MKYLTIALLLFLFTVSISFSKERLKVGIAGLTHTHVHWLLGRQDRGDITIVGIVEPNKDLANRYLKQYGLNINLLYTSLDEMIRKTKPEAVVAFGSIFEHLKVVETCAPLGVHVMVEKPLAVNMDHANRMKILADQYHIQLLTNYETTWYPTNHKIYNTIYDNENPIGEFRKIVVHDGHKGPKEIGCNSEFLDWLTDPVANGGGVIMDFGCYGANLITWLTKGQKPESVVAITQQIKPDIYPKVDDEASFILQYPKMQGIIQASWNWPFNRKDMEVYGQTGYMISENKTDLRTRFKDNEPEQKQSLPERPAPYDDPFSLLAAVIKKEVVLPAFDPSSLENNMVVMQILEAGKESAKTGKAVKIK